MAIEKLRETPTLKLLKKHTEYFEKLTGNWAKNFEQMEATINKIEEDLNRLKRTVDNIESFVLEISDKLAESPLFADAQANAQTPKRGHEKFKDKD